MRLSRIFLVALTTAFLEHRVNAAPLAVDAGFTEISGGRVYHMTTQEDGKIIILGDFQTVANVARNGIARLNADGTLDVGFTPAPSVSATGDPVFTVPLTDRKLLVCGWNQTMKCSIVRLGADGSLDTTFTPDAKFRVSAATELPNGKILASGQFEAADGKEIDRVFRLQPDGKLDSTFQPIDNFAAYSLNVLAGGAIIMSGKFAPVVSSSVKSPHTVLRIKPDGTLDSATFADANKIILRSFVQKDGKIIINGYFTKVGDVERQNIARLNPDGTLDVGFNAKITGGTVTDIGMQADEKIVLKGGFKSVGGIPRQTVARINADGTLDATFQTDIDTADGFAAAVQPNGKIIIEGTFQTSGGTPRYGIVRLNPTGILDDTFNPRTKLAPKK
jgi:uncharacterized delta-60 repeat protein